jgi:hypothetical protein
MRLNFFSRNQQPDPTPPAEQQPNGGSTLPTPSTERTGKTFPADEIVWGIVIRNGFDEIDDPWYHKGTTQHAYLEGNDNVAICGFRPPQSGPRTRRRSRLGLPSHGEHPMCGMCARMVVAPRPRVPVPVPVQPDRPRVAIPVTPGSPGGVPFGAPAAVAAGTPGAPAGQPASTIPGAAAAPPQPAATSPWVRQRTAAVEGGEAPPPTVAIDMSATHDGGLLARGVRVDTED